MTKILIRCDANSKSGFGHFSRCLSFAKVARKKIRLNVHFFGNYNLFSRTTLKQHKFNYTNIEDDAFQNFDNKIFEKYNYVLTDSYYVKQNYLDALAELPIKSIYIDDTCELNYSKVDWIINFRVGAENFHYNSHNKALGCKYFISNPDFKEIRKGNQAIEKIENILLFFGGKFTHFNLVKTIIDTIQKINNNINIHYISSDFKHLTDAHANSINKIQPTSNIAPIYCQVDAIINGGGLTKYDCAYCLIPGASLSTTILQYEDSLVLEKKNLVYNLGYIEKLCQKKLVEKVSDFLQNTKIRQKIYNAYASNFDLNATENLINKIFAR